MGVCGIITTKEKWKQRVTFSECVIMYVRKVSLGRL